MTTADPPGRRRGRPAERPGAAAADARPRHRPAGEPVSRRPVPIQRRRPAPPNRSSARRRAISPFLTAPETGPVVIVAGARPADSAAARGRPARPAGPPALRLVRVHPRPASGRPSTTCPTSRSPISPCASRQEGLLIASRNLCQPPAARLPGQLRRLERRHPERQGRAPPFRAARLTSRWLDARRRRRTERLGATNPAFAAATQRDAGRLPDDPDRQVPARSNRGCHEVVHDRLHAHRVLAYGESAIRPEKLPRPTARLPRDRAEPAPSSALACARPMTGTAEQPSETSPAEVTLDEVVALCKRRGFIFQSSEIYGGLGVHLRLRPLRRPAEEQRQGRVVAGRGAGARRHGGPRRGDPHASPHLGGVGPPGGLHRPDGRLPHLQAALPGRQARGRPVRAKALRASRASTPSATSPSRASST